MYKITLYNMNCCPICDGTATFFVEQLEDFEKDWLKQKYVDEDTKNRYFRSKNGEIVTDYYTNDPKYNIVQRDENAEVLLEKSYQYNDKVFVLYNAYGCESKVYAKETDIVLRYVKFGDHFYLIGKYKLKGVCRENFLYVDDNENSWDNCTVYGNPIHNTKYENVETWIDEKGRRRLDYPKEKFAKNEVETYCWVTVGSFSAKEELNKNTLNELTDEFLSVLMADIPGEAG